MISKFNTTGRRNLFFYDFRKMKFNWVYSRIAMFKIYIMMKKPLDKVDKIGDN